MPVADQRRSRAAFAQPEHFAVTEHGYTLMPFRFARIPSVSDRVLITSETGEYLFLPEDALRALVRGSLPRSHPRYLDLLGKHFITEGAPRAALRRVSSQYRTKRSFAFSGPALFLFVVTLRCDHSCHYCQVSRQSTDAVAFDMSAETARHAVDRMFETPSNDITVEFQGGEPLLAFDRIRQVVALVNERLPASGKQVTFTITTTLHHANDEVLVFLRDNDFQVSTSLDGPAHLHNTHRPTRSRDSYAQTMLAIDRARSVLGYDRISALVTLTKAALEQPEAIIDEYVRLGFRSIFLRPLSPFGFATRSEARIGYPTEDFVAFYDRSLQYILELNNRGTRIAEAYAGILLTHILTPFATGYVDLRSPIGAGLGALVFNYDGWVYPSDEARMMVEMGDSSLRLGRVTASYAEYLSSDAMSLLLASGISESLPGCADCAFLPYCGADPISALSRTGAPISHTYTAPHCIKHMGLFNVLFRHLAEGDPHTLRTFAGWLVPRGASH